MLNNRQAGRRRGRNNQRPQGNGGRNQDNGNRIDNRARGNAPQLLEKYKTLARDAQMQGDRVMTEYYLQFADHYFRVTAEMRARFEENRKQRDDWQGEDGDDGGFDERGVAEGVEGDIDDGGDRGYESQRRQQQQFSDRERQPDRPERPARAERPERSDNDRNARRPNNRETGNREAGNRDGNRDTGNREQGAREQAPRDRDYAPRENGNRNGGWRREEREDNVDSIDVNVLPPAFGSDGPISPIADLDDAPLAEVAEAPAPRRRGRPRKVAEAAVEQAD